MQLYVEPPEASDQYRAEMLAEVKALVAKKRKEADERRKRFFTPDFSSIRAYRESLHNYRRHLVQFLSWPLSTESSGVVPRAREELVGEDSLGRIYRAWVETLPGLHTYGLLFLPPGKGPFPLVLSQHGGRGTPELCSGFFGPSNYSDMTRRVLRRGFAVFAPQLLLQLPEQRGPKYDKNEIDRQLRQFGGSLAALEILRIQRCLDYLLSRDDVDPSRVGMIGLSYGGFYTLFAAATDPRIKVALSSCYFGYYNTPQGSPLPERTWLNCASAFLDAEVAQLVCPRPLYLEVGKLDFRFKNAPPPYIRAQAAKVRKTYERLGIPERFRYKEHAGPHELDKADEGIQFLSEYLDKPLEDGE